MKYSTILIVFSILCASVYGRSTNTIPNKLSSRIINGNIAADGAYPYVVNFQYLLSNVCSGVILNNRWFLGSASCLVYDVKSARIGTNKATKGGQLVRFELRIHHPDYDSSTYNHDLALFKTTENITFNDHVQPISFPTSPVVDDQEAVVTGWGLIDEQSSYDENLRYLPARTLSYSTCRKRISTKLFESQICSYSADPTHEGVCYGDTGAPLVANGTILGFLSRFSIMCLDDEPELYSDVYSHLDWINRILKDYS